VVICDEAHRTQYGFRGRLDLKTGAIKYGLAFTGTPISQDDRDTQAVFGHYISIGDIQQAVEDGATVSIYYESRFNINTVKQKRFGERLQASLAKYANRSVEAAQVIEELFAMAREFRLCAEKAETLGLPPAEEAFYDSLANNLSAQELMGDQILMAIARELAEKLRGNLSIDRQYQENVRARLRTMIRALLKSYINPPDKAAAAIELALQQTEVISEQWARQALGDGIQATDAAHLQARVVQ